MADANEDIQVRDATDLIRIVSNELEHIGHEMSETSHDGSRRKAAINVMAGGTIYRVEVTTLADMEKPVI
jgi:hypothetical protein